MREYTVYVIYPVPRTAPDGQRLRADVKKGRELTIWRCYPVELLYYVPVAKKLTFIVFLSHKIGLNKTGATSRLPADTDATEQLALTHYGISMINMSNHSLASPRRSRHSSTLQHLHHQDIEPRSSFMFPNSGPPLHSTVRTW